MSAAPRSLALPDAAATERLGAALGRALAPGDVVCLSGPLGAGKSALARAAIAALLAEEGRDEPIPSPSYTLTQTYDTAAAAIVHADLYRLSDRAEIDELGLFDDPTAILLIEWAERLGPHAPARRLEIALGFEGEGRTLTATALGVGWARASAAIEEAAR